MLRSPVHHLLEARGAVWGRIGDSPIALHFGSPESESSAMRTGALCDLSVLAKLGVKGPQAAAWLGRQGTNVPQAIYQTNRLSDGGLVVRLVGDEFLLESGVAATSVPALSESLGAAQEGAYRVQRQDATFLLSGLGAREVFAQTCGINFDETKPWHLLMTRVAGATCGVLPQLITETSAPVTAYRLWVDPSYAVYLWETLAHIIEELGGQIIGAATIYPELSGRT